MVTAKTVSGVLGTTAGFILLGYSSIMSPSLSDGVRSFSDFMIIILTIYAATDIVEKLVSFYIKKRRS
ncbi:hypothetical protein ACUY4Q_002536 [Phytobacter sp. AG2a]